MEKDNSRKQYEEAKQIIEMNHYSALYTEISALQAHIHFGQTSPLETFASQLVQHRRLAPNSIVKVTSHLQLIQTCFSIDLKSSALIHARKADNIIKTLGYTGYTPTPEETDFLDMAKTFINKLFESLNHLVQFYTNLENVLRDSLESLPEESQQWFQQLVKLCLTLINLGKYREVENFFAIITAGISAGLFNPDGKEHIALYLSMVKVSVSQCNVSEAEQFINAALVYSVDDSDYISLNLELEQLYRLNGEYSKGIDILYKLENSKDLLSNDGKVFLDENLYRKNRWGYYGHMTRKSIYNIYV
jgi:hypothetical protein